MSSRRAPLSVLFPALLLAAGLVGALAGGARLGLSAALWVLALSCAALLLAFSARRLAGLVIVLVGRPHAEPPDAAVDWPNLLLLIPCRNEAGVLAETIESVGALESPAGKLRVVWIDDGSIDATAALIEVGCRGRADWRVFRVPAEAAGQGKPAALNAALQGDNWAEALAVLDADDRVTPDWAERAVAHLRTGADAVQFPLRIRNAESNAIAAYCALEQLVHQAGTVRLLAAAGCAPLLGHGCAIRREALEAAGLFPQGSRAEDVPLSAELQRLGRRVALAAGPVVSHSAPQTLQGYLSQHAGWARAFAAQRHWPRVRGGAWSRLLFALYLLGYADRPALLVGLALSLAAPWSGIPFPWWLLALPLAAAGLLSLAALVEERAPLRQWLLLGVAPLLFLADATAAVHGQLAALKRGPQPWRVTPKPGRPSADLSHTWAVVVLHGSADPLPACLAALRAAGVQRGVVLADSLRFEHGKPPDAAFAPGFDFIYLERNPGYAAAANRGLELAFANGARHALLCNPDALVAPDAVPLMQHLAESQPDAACVGAAVQRADNPLQLEGLAGLISPNQFLARIELADAPADLAQGAGIEVDFPLGCCLLITARGYARVGGLEPLLYCYHDELEWCERARAAGLRCYVEPAARVRHTGPVSELAQIVKAYFLGRNAELLSRRLRRPGLRPTYRLACALEGLAIALGRQPGDGAGWPARLRGRSDGRNGRPVDPWIAGLVRLDPEARP